MQLVMLGSGHPPYEAAMREQEELHPQHFRGWVGFSIPVAHRIVAGPPLLYCADLHVIRKSHCCNMVTHVATFCGSAYLLDLHAPIKYHGSPALLQGPQEHCRSIAGVPALAGCPYSQLAG